MAASSTRIVQVLGPGRGSRWRSNNPHLIGSLESASARIGRIIPYRAASARIGPYRAVLGRRAAHVSFRLPTTVSR